MCLENKFVHLDLFSGIGGFAYAVDRVWDNAEHIFCDNDKFCQQVLKKHWPKARIYGDIRDITNPASDGRNGGATLEQGRQNETTEVGKVEKDKSCGKGRECEFGKVDLLTGGFPCQPFSQAGKRRGTLDDRYLWPEMLKVIQLCKPQWVIAENVRGLLTLKGGLVFEQVCLDLETSGYEIQAFVIPAIAVNAPHRRDRVWFVAHRNSQGHDGRSKTIGIQGRKLDEERKDGGLESRGATTRRGKDNSNTHNAEQSRLERYADPNQEQKVGKGTTRPIAQTDWERNWLEVATELCGVDDGISPELDFAGWTKARHRVERLKSLGNAIVPQVAIEIMRAIKSDTNVLTDSNRKLSTGCSYNT